MKNEVPKPAKVPHGPRTTLIRDAVDLLERCGCKHHKTTQDLHALYLQEREAEKTAADPYVPIAAALKTLGHESPILIVSRAERAAGDIARAEMAGEDPKVEDLDTAAAISSTLPAVWAYATRGHAGGGDSEAAR